MLFRKNMLAWSARRPARSAVISLMMALIFTAAHAMAADNGLLYQQPLEPYPFQITIPVTIADHTYTFILDTGSTFHCFDPTLKQYLGAPRKSKPVDAGGSNIDVQLYTAPPMKFGAWTLPPSAVGVNDLARFRASFGLNLLGVIGQTALRECALSLDFDHRILKILKGNFSHPTSMKSVNLAVSPTGCPMVHLDLEGKNLDFTIDTGANNYVGLQHEAFVELTGNGAIELDKSIATEAATGMVANARGHFTRGQLLGADLTNLPVDDVKSYNALGMGFLLNYNFIADFKGGTFYYQNRTPPPPIKLNEMLGFVLKFANSRNHIFQIDSESGPVRNAGLKVWDRIVRLGPLNEASLNLISLYGLCVNHAEETLEVEVERPGEEKTVITHLTLPPKEFAYPPHN